MPCLSRDTAIEFFAGVTGSPGAWADGLEQREDGLWPRFDADAMIRALAEAAERDYWKDWDTIRAPTLIVRGEHGWASDDTVTEMVDRHPNARAVELPGAGHDVHLDSPEHWHVALKTFIQQL